MKTKTAQRQTYLNITKQNTFLSTASSKTYQKISKDNLKQHLWFSEKTTLFQSLSSSSPFFFVFASKYSVWQKIKRKISPKACQKNSFKLSNFLIAN